MRLFLFGRKERYDFELRLLLLALSVEQVMSTAMPNTLRALKADMVKIVFILLSVLMFSIGAAEIAI